MIRPAWVGRTLFIGAGIVAFANVIALGGVAYNRSGTPDSELRLSERELGRNWTEEENSGLSLTLRDQELEDSQPRTDSGGVTGTAWRYGYARPYWLDAAKLKEMGFPVPDRLTSDSLSWRTRSLRREALFVLEFDGPAYRRILDERRAAVRTADSVSAARPKDSLATSGALRARRALDRVERVDSRLFAVDAGRNAAALRARYPDRTHYAIVWGRYYVWVIQVNKQPRLVGRISALDTRAINVPHRFRGAIVVNTKPGDLETSLRPVTVTVAFGKRLEPWIESAEKP